MLFIFQSQAICAKCNEVISQRIVTALDKQWHPEHFACRECHTPITESTFNQKDGEPVCTQCYALKYLDVCFSCKQPIKGVCNLLERLLLFKNKLSFNLYNLIFKLSHCYTKSVIMMS